MTQQSIGMTVLRVIAFFVLLTGAGLIFLDMLQYTYRNAVWEPRWWDVSDDISSIVVASIGVVSIVIGWGVLWRRWWTNSPIVGILVCSMVIGSGVIWVVSTIAMHGWLPLWEGLGGASHDVSIFVPYQRYAISDIAVRLSIFLLPQLLLLLYFSRAGVRAQFRSERETTKGPSC